MVMAPLAVCEGLKVPQDPAGAQLQSTPPAAESFVTVAAIMAVAPVESEAGGAWLSEMERVGDGFDVVVELDPQPETLIPSANSIAAPQERNCHFAELVFTTPSYRLAGFALRGPAEPAKCVYAHHQHGRLIHVLIRAMGQPAAAIDKNEVCPHP